jgi:hypothetical protein
MARSRRSSVVAAVAFAAALCSVSPARADGLPVLGVDVGQEGVAVPGGASRYVAIPDGNLTLVQRVATRGGRILRLSRLSGSYTIPAVAYDGSAGGLSWNGRTLVLIEPRQRFPRQTTTFAILDARQLTLRKVVTLRGDFSFDAVSPGGRWMYLIDYTDPQDPTRYDVRAYDLVRERLARARVVDPRERGERMRGSPLTRRASPDGRWAYTLYDGAGSSPFVHALDTATRDARCIDLPMLAGRRDLFRLRLTLAGNRLTVLAPGGALAAVDARTFEASLPGAPAGAGRLVRIAVAGGGLLTLLALASLARRGRALHGLPQRVLDRKRRSRGEQLVEARTADR